jgi:hypothetical protein
MVKAFDYGQRADAAMSDDLERENSRLRAQEENEPLDTSPVGCTGSEVGTMGKWLASPNGSSIGKGSYEDSRPRLDRRSVSFSWGACGSRRTRIAAEAYRTPSRARDL